MRRALLALLFAVLLARVFGLLPSWSQAYSTSPPHRLQTEALLEGRLALSTCPRELRSDLAWSGGGVQQVWGLGVPLLRLPFEALAALFGASAFPDRYVLVAWMGLMLALLSRRLGWPAALLLAAHPPLYGLFHTRFAVYEETAAYAYFAGLGLLAASLGARGRRGAALLGAACGLAALLRPTLALHGLAAMIAFLARSPGRRRAAVPLALGLALGVAPVLLSNAARFGAPMEFGHRLNLSESPLNVYLLKIASPFDAIGAPAAARELAAALFGDPPPLGVVLDAAPSFAGQAPVARFRELYFTTYDAAWAALAALGLVVGLRARRRAARAAALFGAVGFACAFALYLRSPALSSRYLLDFGPALAALGVTPLLALRKKHARAAAFGVLALFASAELARSEVSPYHEERMLTDEAEVVSVAPRPLPCEPLTRLEPGWAARPFEHLKTDGQGWDEATGEFHATITLFLRGARCLHLRGSFDPGPVRAVIDGVPMRRVEGRGELWLVREGEATPGIAVAFLGMVPVEGARVGVVGRGLEGIDTRCP